jgi:Tfp pilus assembly protein PilV
MIEARARATRRPGFALPAALIALVLLSALVAGTLFVSTEEVRSGRSDLADQRALAAADWALAEAIATWDAERNTGQVVGSTDTGTVGPAPNDSVLVAVTRSRRDAVWLSAAARVRGDGRSSAARRTVAGSLRLVGATVPLRAALATLGSVSIDGGVIDGADASAPDTTGLCADSGSAAGVSVVDASRVTWITCASASGVFGAPPIDSAAVADSTFDRFGDETARSLAQRASVVLPGGTFTPRPSVAGVECRRSDPLNWGDPTPGAPCADHFPIVHVRGSAVLGTGAVGQGMLVVDGDLRVQGDARFVGVVFAAGAIEVAGPGAAIVGAAFAASGDGSGTSSVRDGGAIRFASCAVRRAMLGTSRLVPTAGRWWVELR